MFSLYGEGEEFECKRRKNMVYKTIHGKMIERQRSVFEPKMGGLR
jgi:hypothetical protein